MTRSLLRAREAEAATRLRRCVTDAERRAEISELMLEWNCSERSVYRAARAGGWDSGRSPRVDRGSRSATQGEIEAVAQLLMVSKRQDRRCIMDTATALDIAVNAGALSAGVSVSRWNTYLREERLSRRDLEEDIDDGPHVNLISLYPNHVHEFDITNCVQYYFDDKGRGLKNRDMKKEYRLEKPEKLATISRHLLRFLLVDHFSNSFYVKYFYTSGERASDVADFLLEAWAPKEENLRGSGGNHFPQRGVPEILICDRGSACMSGMVNELLKGLGVDAQAKKQGIKRMPHKPGNPRAKGSVEGGMWIWETKFESRLAVTPAPDLDTLNQWAFDFCQRWNNEAIHTRHKKNRTQMWCTIPPDKLKLLPPIEACRELVQTPPEERTVAGNLCISFKGTEYRVSDPNLAGRKVLVSINPYKWQVARSQEQGARRAVVVTDAEGNRFEAREVLRDSESGFRIGERTAIIGETYNRHPDTITQRFVKEATADLADAAPVDAFERSKEQEAGSTVAYLTPAGTELAVSAKPMPTLSVAEALKDVRDGLGRPLRAAEADIVRGIAPNLLNRDVVRGLVERFLAEETRNKEEGA